MLYLETTVSLIATSTSRYSYPNVNEKYILKWEDWTRQTRAGSGSKTLHSDDPAAHKRFLVPSELLKRDLSR